MIRIHMEKILLINILKKIKMQQNYPKDIYINDNYIYKIKRYIHKIFFKAYNKTRKIKANIKYNNILLYKQNKN